MTSPETLNKEINIYQATKGRFFEKKPRIFIADVKGPDSLEDGNVRLISNRISTLAEFVLCNEASDKLSVKIIFPEKTKGKIAYAGESLNVRPISKKDRYFTRFWQAYIDKGSE